MIGYSRHGYLAAMAAAAGILSVGEIFHDLPARSPVRPSRGYALDTSRKQRKAADRSKKQYLLKGLRP